jgi:hypothetical protein
MKHCPTCNRDYEDDSLRFCLDDGSSLINKDAGRAVPEPTMVLPTPQENAATLSQVRRPNVPAPRQPGLNQLYPIDPGHLSARGGLGSSNIRLFIGILLALGLLLVVGGFGLWGMTFGRRIPMLLLCLAGIVIAMVYSKHIPKASLLTTLALELYLLQAFIYTGIISWLPKVAQTLTSSFYTFVGVLDNFAVAAVIILMVAAAFTGRHSNSQIKY